MTNSALLPKLQSHEPKQVVHTSSSLTAPLVGRGQSIYQVAAMSRGVSLGAVLIVSLLGCDFDSKGIGDPAAESTPEGSSSAPGTNPGTEGSTNVEIPVEFDTYVNQATPNGSFGRDSSLRVGSGSKLSRASRTLVWADLSELPNCDITRAELFLYFYADGEDEWDEHDTTVRAYAVTRDWAETFANWADAAPDQPWPTPGGNFDPTVVDGAVIFGGDFRWIRWDITSEATDWCMDFEANYGLLLAEPADSTSSEGRKHFVSGNDWMNEAKRPHIRVTPAP